MGLTEWVEVDDDDTYLVTLAKDAANSVGKLLRSIANTIAWGFLGAGLSFVPGTSAKIVGINLDFGSLSALVSGLGLWLVTAAYDYRYNSNTDLR